MEKSYGKNDTLDGGNGLVKLGASLLVAGAIMYAGVKAMDNSVNGKYDNLKQNTEITRNYDSNQGLEMMAQCEWSR